MATESCVVVVTEARSVHMMRKSWISEPGVLMNWGVEWINVHEPQVFDIEPLVGSYACNWFGFVSLNEDGEIRAPYLISNLVVLLYAPWLVPVRCRG